jgi:hypothetical protein
MQPLFEVNTPTGLSMVCSLGRSAAPARAADEMERLDSGETRQEDAASLSTPEKY